MSDEEIMDMEIFITEDNDGVIFQKYDMTASVAKTLADLKEQLHDEDGLSRKADMLRKVKELEDLLKAERDDVDEGDWRCRTRSMSSPVFDWPYSTATLGFLGGSMDKKQAPAFSECVSSICDLFETAQKDYTWNRDKIVEMDALTQDLLHSLELDGLKYEERAKVATRLSRCRQERRGHKDTVAILEPLVQYLDGEKGRQLFNLLKEVLGKTRKAEERMENRVYYPRVLGRGSAHGN